MQDYEIRYSELLGEGAYGKIYPILHIKTNTWYAVKIEARKKYLKKEYEVLTTANHSNNPDYLHSIGYFENEQEAYMIIPLLGVSFKRIMSQIKKMVIHDVINIIPDMLAQLKFFHDAGFVHRDIKPANFMYSLDLSKIYLIDFGLSTEINTEVNKFVGTANFMSISAMGKKSPKRLDDLYSLGYLILYLSYGRLYWADIKFNNKNERNKKMIKIKSCLSNEDLTRRFCCNECKSSCGYKYALLNYFKYLDKADENEISYDYLISLFIVHKKK